MTFRAAETRIKQQQTRLAKVTPAMVENIFILL